MKSTVTASTVTASTVTASNVTAAAAGGPAMNATQRPPDRGAVVITGASTGIGRATAIALAAAGYRVFAGVRRAADGESLRARAPGQLTPVIIDVTDAISIEAAAQDVAAAVGSNGLAGLVDNAGIGSLWPMEIVPLEELRHQFEVNVFGQVAVIQAFLPLLRLGAGRMINIGSIGDRLMLPFAGPLNSSKQAFAAITEAFRMELRSSGIRVVLIEPASIHTEAVAKVEADADRVLRASEGTSGARYFVPYRTMTRRGLARERDGSSPEVVAAAVLRALAARRPRSRYLVGKDARRFAFFARWMPDPAIRPAPGARSGPAHWFRHGRIRPH
jgi:NAD(P)-dependent dehydrogenase (short-subunit alcohol dehydrogenase family)